MDTTFKTELGYFNYRVAGILVNDGKLLVIKDERSPYRYLPGGRLSMFEKAEDAIRREMREELGIEIEDAKPLFINEAFFTEEVLDERVHEICLYFLIDYSGSDLLSRGESFLKKDGEVGAEKTNRFTWLPFESLQDEYLYPHFIKEEIFHLPEHLTFITEERG